MRLLLSTLLLSSIFIGCSQQAESKIDYDKMLTLFKVSATLPDSIMPQRGETPIPKEMASVFPDQIPGQDIYPILQFPIDDDYTGLVVTTREGDNHTSWLYAFNKGNKTFADGTLQIASKETSPEEGDYFAYTKVTKDQSTSSISFCLIEKFSLSDVQETANETKSTCFKWQDNNFTTNEGDEGGED